MFVLRLCKHPVVKSEDISATLCCFCATVTACAGYCFVGISRLLHLMDTFSIHVLILFYFSLLCSISNLKIIPK